MAYFGSSFAKVSSLNQGHHTPFIERRTFLSDLLRPPTLAAAATAALSPAPTGANAGAGSTASVSVPLVGRFERLKGANSFIGSWQYEATEGVGRGVLCFLKNGEVELLSDDSSAVVAVGAVPWKYVSPKGTDTMVTVTFTLDEDGQDDVLIFQGTMDSMGGPGRTMEGSIATGRAEIGARGGSPMKQVGSFKASFLQ